MTRYMKRGGKVWITIFPDKPITQKPAETRMGSGKRVTRKLGLLSSSPAVSCSRSAASTRLPLKRPCVSPFKASYQVQDRYQRNRRWLNNEGRRDSGALF